MSSKFRMLLATAAAALVSVTSGCGEAGSPVAAALPAARAATTTTEATAADLDIIAKFQVRPQITIAWAKKWIGPEGGRLEFQGFAVDVPAGAVDKVTLFSIRLPVEPNGSERVVAEFGPHGSKFLKPVVVSFPFRGTTIEGAADPTVVWWNNGWVDMGGWLSGDGARLSTYTDHFSEYATTTETAYRGGGILASGG
ncbi:MAG TPA: hypothetical protein VF746_17705 [Longimicrobium sp.]|jgi:hypothetical protein